MAQAIITRRGGGAFRLRIAAYGSVSTLPGTATLYDIAIITTNAVGNVYAQATTPGTPNNGDLWILLGSQSSQPIEIAGSGVKIYPRSVYQYTSSAWALRPSYAWSGTAWVPLSLYIYDSGMEIMSPVSAANQGYSYSSVSIIEEAARITFDHNAQSGRWLWTDNLIDITELATLKARISNTYTTGYTGYFGIASNKTAVGTSMPTPSAMSAYTTINSSHSNSSISVDISGYNGNYYIGIYFYNPVNYIERVYAIWMEP